MKKKRQKNKGFLLFLAFFISAILIALLVKVFYIQTKTYHSKLFGFTIDYPKKFELEEKIGSVHLNMNKSNSRIVISGIGTNFDNLDRYLLDISDYNHSKLTNKENLTINNLSAVKVDINGHRYYLIYKNNWVYTLNTNSPDLYSDLDRIARSFRYEP